MTVEEEDEVRNPDIPEADLRAEHGGFLGPNPYYLMIVTAAGRHIQIDLDEPGWRKSYKAFLRAAGQWYLVRKVDGIIVLTMLVLEGEQPYYVARHVGFAGTNDAQIHAETVNYGIGKKRLDGHVDRIWVMANGCITLGDDVEPISLDLLKAGML